MSEVIQTMEFKKVSMEFDGFEILQACDFDFPMNQNCRLVFNNDREKFIFYHSVTQIKGFARGQFLLNNHNVTDMSFEEFLRFRTKIGFGFSTRGLINNQTLRQNLELPLRYHRYMPVDEIASWVDHCASYFEMGPELDRRPSEVSTSAQKSTLILRGFIHRPELVFLDTPELMLSSKLHANLLQFIDDQKAKYNLKHLFFSTYDEDISDCLSEKNIILSQKRLNLVQSQFIKRVAS